MDLCCHDFGCNVCVLVSSSWTFRYRYCRMLEEGSFRGRTADFVFMFLFGGFLMTVSFKSMLLNGGKVMFITTFKCLIMLCCHKILHRKAPVCELFLFPVAIPVYMCPVLNETSDIWDFCQPCVLGPSLYNHAGVCLEQEKPQCSDELLRSAEFPGPLPSLGAYGLFPPSGQLHHCGSFGYQPIAAFV